MVSFSLSSSCLKHRVNESVGVNERGRVKPSPQWRHQSRCGQTGQLAEIAPPVFVVGECCRQGHHRGDNTDTDSVAVYTTGLLYQVYTAHPSPSLGGRVILAMSIVGWPSRRVICSVAVRGRLVSLWQLSWPSAIWSLSECTFLWWSTSPLAVGSASIGGGGGCVCDAQVHH